MQTIEISDIDDPRIADYRDIRDRARADPALFVAETALVVERMLALPGVTRSVMLAPRWMDRIAPQAPPGVPVYVAALPLMQQIAGFPIHRGVLGVGSRAAVERQTLDEAVGRSPRTLLLCEDITNIDNIGMLFRNAAAFGADAVVLSPRCHDPLYRKSLRVSIGHALTVPFARSTDWSGDLDRLARDRGITLIGAATTGDAVPIDAIEPPDRVGLIVGREHDGLSPATLRRCSVVARVPMAPGVDSLNVAAAAAVCLHRLSRARLA